MSGPVLVVGAAGRLAAAILHAFADRPVIGLTRAALDITDPESVSRAVAGAAPAVIINCAAFNDVDGAEDRPSAALALNAFAVRSLARAAETCGARLVHYSTDFVFDGEASDPYPETAAPAPRSTYALSKLLGEWFALDVPGGFVLRVESLFGSPAGWTGRRGTLDGILEGLEQGRDVKAFTDRVVSPSHVGDVAAATRHLIDSGAAPGIYHCVNSGWATWYDVANEAASMLGVQGRLVPVTLASIQLKAPRPRYCALDNQKLADAGFRMPTWQDALVRWLAERRQNSRMNETHG
jgi:dTDP-4-dehydrorhamnose reductase